MDLLFFKNTMRLRYCTSNRNRQVFHGEKIIVIRFSIFILPLLNEINVSVEKKIPLVPTRTLCIKAVVNMEDKHPLNLVKFHLFVKLFLSCPKNLTTNQLPWTKLLSIKSPWFHIFTFQLPFLVCHRK